MDPMETNRAQSLTTATPRLGAYRIDTAASTVTFTTRHFFGLAPVRGTFALRSGTVDIAEPRAASAVHVEIDTASFTTGDGARDDAVRSPRFLDTARHPVMTYTADGLTDTTLTGTLTVCGVARRIPLTVEAYDATPEGFTARATARIDRMHFGVTAARGLAGRYLEVEVRVSCVR
jgi:polyisoprenoid-binding protein YceI